MLMRMLFVCLSMMLALSVSAQEERTVYQVEPVMRFDFPSGPANTSSHLSPDGRQLLHIRQQSGTLEFCRHAVLEDWTGACAELNMKDADFYGLFHDSVTWSPDSRYVAFTEDWLVMLSDPDIWVMDVDAGTFHNLTDDGYAGGILSYEGGPLNMDLVPTWMPDGRLSFARHIYEGSGSTSLGHELLAISPDTGEMEKLGDIGLADQRNFIVGMDWAPDGSRMAFILDAMNPAETGVWMYDAETGESQLIFQPTREYYGTSVIGFSPTGDDLLVRTNLADALSSGAKSMAGSGVFVISMETLESTPVAFDMPLHTVGWLPNGGGLIYAASTYEKGQTGLYITTDVETAGELVYSEEDGAGAQLMLFVPTPRRRQLLRVASNSAIVVGTQDGGTVVAQISAG